METQPNSKNESERKKLEYGANFTYVVRQLDARLVVKRQASDCTVSSSSFACCLNIFYPNATIYGTINCNGGDTAGTCTYTVGNYTYICTASNDGGAYCTYANGTLIDSCLPGGSYCTYANGTPIGTPTSTSANPGYYYLPCGGACNGPFYVLYLLYLLYLFYINH